MAPTRPIADNTIRDDFTTDFIQGGRDNDHLIHHRDPSVGGHDGTGLASFYGDDILEGSVPDGGQIHMYAGKGDDWLILDVTKVSEAIGMQGHHAYAGHGQDTFQFTNIGENLSPIVGRLDDFDPTSDHILIEDTEIDLTDLPQSVTLPGGGSVEVRVIEIEHPEFLVEELGSQYFLAIGEDIFYALDGARDLQNGTSGLTGEERHFLRPPALETLRSAETVQYENPKNFVPREFYEDREDDLNLNWYPDGDEVFAETGDKTAAHMFGGKGNPDAPSASGAQVMHGSDGDDVIDGNTGNDTISGGPGDDLIAGGIDNDVVHGGADDDMVWGGDGDDELHGDSGDDYLHGGRGDDVLSGGEGDDTLAGGGGNDTLEGGGGEDAINRFHFYEEGGHDVILDFKVGLDLITLQDDIDPVTVELFENEDGNTVLNYGETGSVELSGVPLASFQEAAETRAEEDDPIITITPDPEEEMLQAYRVESGFYGDEAPPDLEVEGLQYGATAFRDSGPGGYTYVEEHEIDEGSDEDNPPDTDDEQEGSYLDDLPKISSSEEDQEKPAEEAQEIEVGTCFVATAAYGDPWHPDVVFLRAFRDQWLVHRAWGRAFIAFYWRVGPIIAGPVRRRPGLARPSKALISGIVGLLRKVWAGAGTEA
ncbi:calcium-binding protein [Sinisalibacter lacisalsi]|uniref:Uncharacterized protein n=1 Tax=Sinisalibacter lacisalsi TaxID=1526570 RepID=A0ABQ1QJU0_9RHOB|nr:calcium-binding protein [Sinisalibacter lacisalsi]GGD28586.1 hypothetical protein GCM10011358_10890 [Sinisalibacter lacisalsi]